MKQRFKIEMHNIRVKLTIDIFIMLIIFITFGVAVNDLFSMELENLYRIRGSFLFVATLVGEELAYYVTTGVLYKKKFIFNTVIFLTELLTTVLVFSFMVSGFDLNYFGSWVFALLLMIYPAKSLLVCIQDVRQLHKYLGFGNKYEN